MTSPKAPEDKVDRAISVLVPIVLYGVVGLFIVALLFGLFWPKPTPQPLVGGGVGGYENPVAGNDGSFDCPPGGGPIAVPPGDPAGLDADGDGIGCE